MIKHLSIKNFKSVRALDLNCKKVNLFLGEPNVGKSNILEAISLLNMRDNIRDFVRFENLINLFFDFDITKEIEIRADDQVLSGAIENQQLKLKCNLKGGFSPYVMNYFLHGQHENSSYNDNISKLQPVRYYKYKEEAAFVARELVYLSEPYGDNLDSVLQANKALRNQVSSIIKSIGFKLVIKPSENKIEIYKESDEITYSLPYATMSDTVKRIIFYLAAIETNENTVLLLEEPEAHTFPFYTQDMAERITLDENNQFFIITHNPYLLQTIIEKTPSEDLQVNICYTENYETKVHPLTTKSEISEMIDMTSSVFFNLDKFVQK